MGFFVQVFGAVIAFSMVMLVVSLIITFLVRAVHYLGNFRAATLGEMLGALNVGYRLAHDDQAEAGDVPSTEFVTDVLTFPALHPSKRLSAASTKRSKLSASLDYIAKEDLLQIVCRRSGQDYVPGQVPEGSIPERWYRHFPGAKAQSLKTFVAYLDAFFETAEGVSSNQFKASTKRLTLILGCIVVVLVNLDSLQLARAMLTTGQETSVSTASYVLNLAHSVDVGAGTPPNDRNAFLGSGPSNFASLASLLNTPQFGLGWQQSWFPRAICVSRGQCTAAGIDIPGSCGAWVWRILVWLAGLALSCGLLSVGAPFWAKQLENLLGWKSAVIGAKSATDSQDE